GRATGRVPTDRSLRKLRSYLAQGQVGHADIVTTALVIEVVGRLDRGWLRRGDGDHLPFVVLDLIDAAWSELSQDTQRVPGAGGTPSEVGGAGAAVLEGRVRGAGRLARLEDLTGRGNTAVRRLCPGCGQHIGFFPTSRNPQTEGQIVWHDQ